MPRLKEGHISPTEQEDKAINLGIQRDEDTHELGEEWFANAKPADQFFSADVYANLIAEKRTRGRPKLEETKVFTTIRLDSDILEAFKATGKGWQTRMNLALRQYLNAEKT